MSVALVVDDHPITHVGCRRLLTEAGYERVLEALNAEQACRLATAHRPRLMLVDLAMPLVGGLQLIPRLLDRVPEAALLVFSMNDSPIFAAQALEAGARGFLSKSSRAADFTEAVRTVEAGRVYLERSMATELAMLNVAAKSDPLAGLSAREHQVLQLVGKGCSHGEIAERVHVSYKTVANICALLKRKLNVRNHSDLIRLAIERERTR